MHFFLPGDGTGTATANTYQSTASPTEPLLSEAESPTGSHGLGFHGDVTAILYQQQVEVIMT
jgi:hypothetical protein